MDEQAERHITINSDSRGAAAFLMTVPDKLTAGAYEEMLKKNNVAVTLEHRESYPFATISNAGGAAFNATSVNIYVSTEQLHRARELIEAYENQPIVYKTPPPVLNQKSRSSQALFAIIVILIFVIPIGASIYAIGSRILKFITR